MDSCLTCKRAISWSDAIIQLIFVGDLFRYYNAPPSGGWHILKVAGIEGVPLTFSLNEK
jgi:hypothetical protein